MNVNPLTVIKQKIIRPVKETKVQQVGIDLTLKDDITLQAKQFANVQLAEQFNMQSYMALLIIRSSYSRMGIFMSSGVFDAGFCGVAGISIYNFTDATIKLKAGTRICQAVVFNADYASLYDGFYNKNETIKSQLEVK